MPSTGSFVSSTGSLQKNQIDLRGGPEGLEYVHEAYPHPCFHSSPLFHHFFHVIMLISSKLCVLQEVPVEITGFLQEARNGFEKGILANMIASSRVQKSSYNLQTSLPSIPSLHYSPSSFFLTMQKTAE